MNLKVVKLSQSPASSLKKEVYDSFVVTVRHLAINVKEIHNWLHLEKGIVGSG